MADTTTATYGLTKPEPGASDNTWGAKLNANFDALDDILDGTTAFTRLRDTVYALTGTTPAIDPANGQVQQWTLTGNSAPTDSLSSGDSVLLMIDDGAAYTITWPTITWVGGSVPTLATSGYTCIVIWKAGSTLYGAYLGDA